MPQAVSDTSPILNLAIIGHLDLLRLQFGVVHVPWAVVSELRLADDLPGNDRLRKGFEEHWLIQTPLRTKSLATILSKDLDHGESEAIALADEMKGTTLLLDERDARLMAKRLGLTVTGVLGVLAKAKRQDASFKLAEAVADLKLKAGFFISEDLSANLLSI